MSRPTIWQFLTATLWRRRRRDAAAQAAVQIGRIRRRADFEVLPVNIFDAGL